MLSYSNRTPFIPYDNQFVQCCKFIITKNNKTDITFRDDLPYYTGSPCFNRSYCAILLNNFTIT
jgi:hypothetical protein